MNKLCLSMLLCLPVLSNTAIAQKENFEIKAYRQWIVNGNIEEDKNVFLKTEVYSNNEEEIDLTFKKGMNVYYPQKYNEEQPHEIININLRYDVNEKYLVSSFHEQVFPDSSYMKMSSSNTLKQKFDENNMIIFSYQNETRKIGTDETLKPYQETWIIKKVNN